MSYRQAQACARRGRHPRTGGGGADEGLDMTAVADVDHAGPALLDVRVHLDRGALLVSVAGEVDLLTAPEIARAVLGHLVARPRCVELDLSRVTYFGVTGIA